MTLTTDSIERLAAESPPPPQYSPEKGGGRALWPQYLRGKGGRGHGRPGRQALSDVALESRVQTAMTHIHYLEQRLDAHYRECISKGDARHEGIVLRLDSLTQRVAQIERQNAAIVQQLSAIQGLLEAALQTKASMQA